MGAYRRCEWQQKFGGRCHGKVAKTIAVERLIPEVQAKYPEERLALCNAHFLRALRYGDPGKLKRASPTRWKR